MAEKENIKDKLENLKKMLDLVMDKVANRTKKMEDLINEATKKKYAEQMYMVRLPN